MSGALRRIRTYTHNVRNVVHSPVMLTARLYKWCPNSDSNREAEGFKPSRFTSFRHLGIYMIFGSSCRNRTGDHLLMREAFCH